MKNYFIWGMGLLGASLALDLKKAGNRVMGCVRSRDNLEYLRSIGFADTVGADASDEIRRLLREADIILLGVPVDATREVLSFLAASELKSGVAITDMGSTKQEVMRIAIQEFSQLAFCGSHPMAGSELSGPQHAREELFRGATVYVTPGLHSEADAAIFSFWESLGCRVTLMAATEHDRQLAYLSHGLHLLSCASVHLLKDIPAVIDCEYAPAAGSFRDISRVAASSPPLWKSIIDSNREEVLHYLSRLEYLVHDWREQLAQGTLDIEAVFGEAGELRRRILKN